MREEPLALPLTVPEPARVRCKRRFGLSRVTVELPVDAATAARFRRTERWEPIWWYGVAPLASLFALGALVRMSLADDPPNLTTPLLVVAMLIAIGRTALDRSLSPHHPLLLRDGSVQVPGVPSAVAHEWQQRNPHGVVEVAPTAVPWRVTTS